MINIAAKSNVYDCSWIEQVRKVPINAEHKEQVQTDRRKSFNEICEVMRQFSSKLVGIRENSVEGGIEKKDKKNILTIFATLVANNNDLWDEFIKDTRETKIITNEGVLLAFEEFRVKKSSKICKKNINRSTDNSKIQRCHEVLNCANRCMNRSNSESNVSFSDKVKFALTERIHSCPQFVSFNEDIYIPEEESNVLTKIASFHELLFFKCLQDFEKLIG